MGWYSLTDSAGNFVVQRIPMEQFSPLFNMYIKFKDGNSYLSFINCQSTLEVWITMERIDYYGNLTISSSLYCVRNA